MKYAYSLLTILAASFGPAAQNGNCQGFQNLNFESANVAGFSPGSTVPAAAAFPGWGLSSIPAWYDGISLGGVMISVNDSNTGFGFLPLEGNYSAFLFGGLFDTPATISQTAVVPSDTLSIQMMIGTYMPQGFFQVTLDGQTIAMTPIASGSGYTLLAGDASSFAGSSSTLAITAQGVTTGSSPNRVLLDNIFFSSTGIPEPSAFSLFGLGALLLGWHWHRKHSA